MRIGTEKKIEKVEKLVDVGVSATAACKRVGIGYNTFVKYRKNVDTLVEAISNKRPEPTAPLPLPNVVPTIRKSKSQLIAVVGSPEEVAKFITTYTV